MFPRPLLQRIPHRFSMDWAAILYLIAQTDFGKICFLDRVVGVYREHTGGVFSCQTSAHKAMMDVETLFKVIPLFKGQDQRYLKNLLRENVAMLLEANGVSRLAPLRCAAMAAFRSPGAFRSLRDLLLSLWLAVAPRYPNAS